MTHVGMFEEARQASTIKKLKKRIVELMEINKEHQTLNGKMRSEFSIEQKNHDLVKEEVEILNLELKLKDREIGRMYKKLSN